MKDDPYPMPKINTPLRFVLFYTLLGFANFLSWLDYTLMQPKPKKEKTTDERPTKT